MNAKKTELENGCFKLEPQEKYNLGNVYYYNSKYEIHREGGPAIEASNGSKYWYLNGNCHRTDGPAIEEANGSKYWYINGIKYSEEEFNVIKEVLWAI